MHYSIRFFSRISCQEFVRCIPQNMNLVSSFYKKVTPRRITYSFSPIRTTYRHVCSTVTAVNFDNEVLQSQQAICLVYYIENSNCNAYLRHAEKLIDELNSNTTVRQSKPKDEEDKNSSNTDSNGMRENDHHACLKFCKINADENRNLASAFSVERAKLPITLFIMQGTIIDKVNGHIKENRLHNILCRFIEHYQKEMNVDLLVKRGKESAVSEGMSSPLPAASIADLRSGSSTKHIIQHLTSSLSGAEKIRLPEEAEKLDGLRKTIQETKRKAYGELVELRREIGLDVRNLSESEREVKYYRSPAYHAMAAISALEALYLARCYASIGDIARKNIIWAKREILSTYEYVVSSTSLVRELMALVEVNVVKGDLRVTALAAQRLFDQFSADQKGRVVKITSDLEFSLPDFFTSYIDYTHQLQKDIDQFIDTRDFEACFPSAFAEELFETLKKSRKILSSLGGSGGNLLSSKSNRSSTSSNITSIQTDEEPWSVEWTKLDSGSTSFAKDDTIAGNTVVEPSALPSSSSSLSDFSSVVLNDSTSIIRRITADQFRHAKIVLSCLVQLHIKDQKGQAARSRLASLVY